jgi:hypothetical protein
MENTQLGTIDNASFSLLCGDRGDRVYIIYLYFAERTNHEALLYAVFSILVSLHLSSVQIFSSAPCSRTPSVYIPLLLSGTKFHTHIETHNYRII